MKIRLKILLIISFFVSLYAAYYWGVPAFVGVEHKTGQIQKYIERELGTDVEIKNPKLKMGLMPAIWIDASYFKMANENSTPLEVVKPKLKVSLLPLLVGKIHLAYFSCDKINADLRVDKNYRLYIGDYLLMKTSNPKLSIEDSKMDIEGYTIKIKDEIQGKNVLLKGDFFELDKYNSKKYVKFSANSKLTIDKRTSVINADVDFKLPFKKGFDTNKITFDGAITNLDLADFSPYIKKLTKGKIQKTAGIINVEADTIVINRRKSRISTQMAIQDFAVIGKDKPSSVYFKNKLNLRSVCDFSKNNMTIKKFQILSGSINLEVKGRVSKISSKNPNLDLSVQINKSKSQDFIYLIPVLDSIKHDVDIAALKKYGLYSDIFGKIYIKGKFDRPSVTGDFLSQNAYLIKLPPLNTSKGTVKLKFLGDKLYMDVYVPTNGREYISVKGYINLYDDKKAQLDILTSNNVDLKAAQSVLVPLHEIFYFDLGPMPIMDLQGVGNINLKVQGSKMDPHLFGELGFRNASTSFEGLDLLVKNCEGKLFFRDKDTHLVVKKAYFEGKPVSVDGKCTLNGVLDYNITANSQELNKMLEVLKNSSKLEGIQKSIPEINNATGKANLTLNLKGKVRNVDDFAIGKTVIASGNLKLLGNNVAISNLNIPIKNLFGNIKFKGKDADFDMYSNVDKSKIYIKGKVRNNVLSSRVKLDDIAFLYEKIPVKIFSGNLELRDNKLVLYKVNATLDGMPVLADGTVTNIFKKPKFNIYLNSKPSQKFIEKYVNKNITYPLKIKGDIICSARISGDKSSFNTKAEIALGEDSSIYYMGSTVGDVNNPIRMFLDTTIVKKPDKNIIYVHNFQYDKLISSQNNREFVSPQMNAKGQIDVNSKDIVLHNFRVKTVNPTDAKIFNILFKKPLIKQGLFSSNVVISNSISSPFLFGYLNFTGIDIPLLDTTIKDISLNFRGSDIDIKSKGEVFSNQIILLANMKNSLTPPYVINSADIYLGNLDINQITKRLSKLEFETDMHKLPEQKQDSGGEYITNIVIQNAKLKADSVSVKNVLAKDLTADLSLNEKLLLSMENFKFDVAEGSVKGDFKYNLLNSKSELSLNVDNVNANEMAEALFDLKNQIYGSLTGQADLTCNGKTHKTCMDTISGRGGFRVADGKMPKLGSMEYLLKAANLVKSGVTGLTINGIIELLSPLKTGHFDTINGTFTIDSGLANDVQIFSKGKDLSLFLTGTYNFSTLIADMKVYGRISKKISNVLGAVGNTSINTLFNAIPGVNLDETNNSEAMKNFSKIPGFEFDDKSYRIFSAEIYGDINGENYVQSFKWVE